MKPIRPMKVDEYILLIDELLKKIYKLLATDFIFSLDDIDELLVKIKDSTEGVEPQLFPPDYRKIRDYIETCDEGLDRIYYNLDKILTAIKDFQKFLGAIGG